MRTLLLGAMIVLAAFSSPIQATAATVSGIGFGGYILFSFPCTCSTGYYVVVAGVSPGAFVYYPGFTPTYLYGQLYKPGTAVLGTYTPGGVCLMTATPCVPLFVTGTMTMVGTSPI